MSTTGFSPPPNVWSPSPSPSPSQSPSKSPAQCVNVPSDITNQLLNNDSAVRFQCLAYSRVTSSFIQTRCNENCKIQCRPELFERAGKILQQNTLKDHADSVTSVIRVLFCRKHGNSQAFKKFYGLLNQHWIDVSDQEKMTLIEALRQVLPLMSVNNAQRPSIVGSSSFPASNPLILEPESKSASRLRPRSEVRTQSEPTLEKGMRPESEDRFQFEVRPVSTEQIPGLNIQLNRSLISDETELTDEHPVEECQPVANSESNRSQRKLRIPIPMSERRRSRSNPPALQKKISPFSSLNLHITDVTSEESTKNNDPSTHFQVPSNKSFDFSFPWNSSSNLHPLPIKQNHFQPIEMPMRSKDDTFIEQVRSSADKAAPTLYQTIAEPSASRSGVNSGSRKNGASYTSSLVDDYTPSLVNDYLRVAILKPVTKEGYIYVLRAPEYFKKIHPGKPPLVKVGIAVNVPQRIAELKKTCGLFDLEKVYDSDDRRHTWYYKVEELVHTELMSFKSPLSCGKCQTVAHQEWFAVPEEVAIQSVQRWRKFISLEPYGDNGQLQDHWNKMVKPINLKWPTSDEEYDHHEKRNNRWNRWLEEGIQTYTAS